MIMSVTMTNGGKVAGPQECAGCNKKIHDKFILKAMDLFWHEDCLKCGCCDCRLGEVGQSLYTKGNLLLCKRDYLRLFGSTGYCSACKKVIPAFEMVMRARTNVYHLECFACQQCGHRFCVGDQFFLLDNKVLCGADYEERMVFANLSANPAQLAQIKHATFPSSGAPRQGHVPLNNNSIPNESSSSQYFMDSSHSSNKDLTPLPPISSVRSSFLGGSAIQT
eukprot:TRINITY_DN7892_c0_g1_i1.p1 TRINITY_DN7892_c0_g1~~TRINITY_DN7892_c0_g1_i1.p1  ORF type:complete len:222 (+),score=32.37 TRINITY_DN7892_c0_g1_i1:57-722(+)